MHMSVVNIKARRGRWAVGSTERELQVVTSGRTWVLGLEHGSL